VTHLEDVDVEELQRALEHVEGTKPTQRLTAAIAYKNGITQTELADWYDVERKTIYNWLVRLETEPIEAAARDDERSGRERKLSGDRRVALERTVREPPSAAGHDEPAWTPGLVQEHVAKRYDVEYSVPSCRRLLRDAGLQYYSPLELPVDGESAARDTASNEGHSGGDGRSGGDRDSGGWLLPDSE